MPAKKKVYEKKAKKSYTKAITKADVYKMIKEVTLKSKEKKRFDYGLSNISIDAVNPINANLTRVVQGLLDNNRIGDNVHLEYLSVKLTYNSFIDIVTPSNNAETTVYRIMIVQDKSYNVSTSGAGSGAGLTLSQLLMNDPETSNPGPRSSRNIDHLKTLIVLYDKTFTTTLLNNALRNHNIKVPLKWCARTIQWANANSITNITNGLFLIVVNDQPNGLVPSLPVVTFQSHITFTDS